MGGGICPCYLRPGGEGVFFKFVMLCYLLGGYGRVLSPVFDSLVNVTLRYFLGGYEGVFMGFVTLRRAGDSTPSSVMLLYEGSRRQGLHYFLGGGGFLYGKMH